MGVLPYRWMVYFRENPRLKLMVTRDTTILGNLHMEIGNFLDMEVSGKIIEMNELE